jgi:hypothetical protein
VGIRQLRTVSAPQRYFNLREGHAADWELKGLSADVQQLQLVNQAFWQRIHATCEAILTSRRFLTFFSMASSMTYSLEPNCEDPPLVMGSRGGHE